MVGDNIEALKRKEILRSEIDANKLEDLMTTKFATIDPEMALSDVVAKMKKEKLHEIPVVDGKKLSRRGELQHPDPEEERGHGSEGKACHGDPAQGEGIDASHRGGRDVHLHQLPKPAHHQGLAASSASISRKDVVKLILNIKEIRNITVKDIMSTRDQGGPGEVQDQGCHGADEQAGHRTIPVVDKTSR